MAGGGHARRGRGRVKAAAILIIGDEVLSGEVRDENGPWLVGRLTALGTRIERISTVRDRAPDIVDELRRLRATADAVVVSGGIGPTHDDLTRPAVASALGVPLERHPGADAHVRRWYGERTTEAELSMADLPRGSRLLIGAKTTALGFFVSGVYVLPGVPFLLRDLIEGSAAEFSGPPLHRVEVTLARREGEIAEALTRLQASALDTAIGSYPSIDPDGSWSTRIVVRSSDAARAASVAAEVRAAFGSP